MSGVIAEGSYPVPREWLDVPAIKDYSLVFPIDRANQKVLLGLKKRGFAQGIWNGFGGKPEEGEDMAECAARELTEESGIIPEGLIERGTLIYYSKNALIREGGDLAVKVWVYTCESWTGVPSDTEEMRPEWFEFPETLQEPFDALPWAQMHIEANMFLPTLLLLVDPDQKISGRADFYPCDSGSDLVQDLTSRGEQLDSRKKTALGEWVIGKWIFEVESNRGR